MKRSPQISAAAFILLRALALIGVITTAAIAQDQSQYDHGTPPQHAAGIGAFGSYTASDLGTINLSNASLNFKIPLGSVGGRGFSLPLILNYSNKVWSANLGTTFDPDAPNGGANRPIVYAVYDDPAAAMDIYQRVAPGWSLGAVPVLRVRGMGISSVHNANCDEFSYALTKLTLILPDKGEIELRDDATDGAPLSTGYYGSCRWMDGNRGQRWHATDGSGTIFISDATNGVVNGNLAGTVITGDGMRYRIVDTAPYSGASVFLQEFGRTDRITDRNGNILNINYPSGTLTQYVDQLGRTTSIEFGALDPVTSEQLAVLVTFKGYGGANRYYRIKTGVMNQHYRAGINPTLPVINGDNDPLSYGYALSGAHTSLFPDSYGSGKQYIDTQSVLTQLVLPDGRTMTFNYNEYGEVAEVVTPTGGKVQYDFANTPHLPAGNSAAWEIHPTPAYVPSDVDEIDRGVVARRTYADGSTLESNWSYSYSTTTGTDGNGWATATGGYTDVQARAADNSLLLNQRHYFMDSKRFLLKPGGTGYSLWSAGIEYRTETRNDVNTVIAASEEDWSQRAVVSWSSYTTQQIAKDNRVNESRKILDDGSIARVQTFYQAGVAYNNPVDVKEFDFDQVTVRRHTTTTYADSSNLINGADYTADSIRLVHLPLVTTVYEGDGTSTKKAQTSIEYDVYADDGNRGYLTSYNPVTQHDSTWSASYYYRGNVTCSGSWLNLTDSLIYSYPRYDILGNVVSAKDANGNISTVNYTDDFGDGSSPGTGASGTYGATYALPTLITSPAPQSHTARSQYDFSTGLLTGFKDRNSVITQTIYNDSFDRPTLVKTALGITGSEAHTATYYAPTTAFGITLAKNDVLTAKDQSSLDDAALRSWTKTDGFGRTVEAWSRDPLGDDKVVTNYDALGRTKQVSNPFRPSASESAIYTNSVYDFAGRVTSVTTPDSAVVGTSYYGNTVTVTDQAGKARKSVTDALGRMTSVYEDPSGLNYQTSYAYDALDNLTQVSQGSQIRTFAYDSLKRLTSATNPESGTISYQYDNNSNLTQKTDARSIVTTYAYDALNRNTTVNYSNTSVNPDIERHYDNTINYSKGRFWYDLYYKDDGTIDHQAVDGYDPYGRVWVKRQVFYSGSQWYHYESRETYDLAGHPKTIQYPSNHTVTYNYDTAGRLADNGSFLAFTGNLGDGTSRTYSQGIIYNPLGGMTKEQFGTTPTAVYNKLFYNSRGQLGEIRLSTSYTDPSDTTWDRGAIINSYSASCSGMCGGHNIATSMTDNNGNLKTQQVMIPSSDSFLQTYAYDSLNRLQSVSEAKNGGSTNWQQQYVYDRYGNRTIDQTNTWGTGIPKPNFGVDTNTNRLTASGMSYDSAGNVTNDTFTGEGSREYDAENKMTKAWANGQWQYYAYDADGHRTRRKVNGTETWQVYGPNGELLVEYASAAAASSPQKEYGYRNGQLLVTAEPGTGGGGGGGTQNVSWTNAAGVSVSGNNLTDTTAAGWGDSGASSTQTIASGDGYVEFTTTGSQYQYVICGLSHGDTDQNYPDVDFGFYPAATDLYVIENGTTHLVGTYAVGDTLRVAVESGVVKYKQNGTVVYTSTISPTYPLLVDTASYQGGISNAVINTTGTGGGGGSSSSVHWLVTDQLGTPRMIVDQTGSLANMSRHDYLPFGEELPGNFRTGIASYAAGDGARQKFTQKERDNETGLDYFFARSYSSTQGRFTSPDEFTGGPTELFADVAPHNPTFYADIANPQSLNKYQYTLNNPLLFIDPDGHQETKSDRLTLPTDTYANRILSAVGQARSVTNNIMMGPVGAKASDALLDGIGKGIQAFNKAQWGPLGDTVNAIQDNPTVQVLQLAAVAGGLASEFMGARSLSAAAMTEANNAQSLPGASRPGAAGALRVRGETFTNTSGEGALNPRVQASLDRVPTGQRSSYHGKCCEPRLASDAFNAGVNPRGGQVSVVRIRGAGNPAHGTPLAPCPSCRIMLKDLGIKF